MNVQVFPSRAQQRNLLEKQYDAHKVINAANDLFVKGKFEEVIKLCKAVTGPAANISFLGLRKVLQDQDGHDESDEERNKKLRFVFLESLCLLVIQSFAELDQWKQVDPFLLKCFENHKSFPPQVLLVCIRLYSQVQYYELAEYASSQWISSTENLTNQQYCIILEGYIRHILLPQNKFDKAGGLLDESDPDVVKGDLKDKLRQLIKDREAAANVHKENSEGAKRPVSLVERISIFISKFIPPSLQKLAVFGFFLYVLLFRTNLISDFDWPKAIKHLIVLQDTWTSDLKDHNITSYSNSVVSRGVLQAWRALFAPFHMMSS